MQQQFSALSTPGIKANLLMAMDTAFGTGWAPSIGQIVQSDQEMETYPFLGQSPGMRRHEGEIQPKGMRKSTLQIRNWEWESTLEVLVADRRWDKTGQLQMRINDHGSVAGENEEDQMSSLIADGETLDGHDSKKFFAANHVWGESGTQSNLLTASDVPELAVVSATHPTQFEFAQAALGVMAHMCGFKGDYGRYLNGRARQFTILVPLKLLPAATPVATAAILLAADGRSIQNPLATSPFKISVEVDPRQSWAASFAVFRTDAPVKPFVIQRAVRPYVQALAEGSEEEVKHGRHLFVCKASGRVGLGRWECAAKATFSDEEE